MGTQSDEQSTDISSPYESDSESIMEQADKQILEWASKLELETIDLREKSATLIEIFKKKSNELTSCIEKLNCLNREDGLLMT